MANPALLILSQVLGHPAPLAHGVVYQKAQFGLQVIEQNKLTNMDSLSFIQSEFCSFED